MNMIVKSAGIESLGTGPSVLGERMPRIPVAGRIRSGIKILTPAVANNAKAIKIYTDGVNAGDTWDSIEKKLRAELKVDRSPLMPRNVQYFTVRTTDFVMPEVAKIIRDTYATDGPSGRQLYRFPVIFPLDQWQAVIPHGLHCFTRSELLYWSEYGPDGRRYCMTHAPVEVDAKAKRAHRPFGGRTKVMRQENGGVCDPQKCRDYQERRCNLTGSFLFYVPGVPGSSAIQLPTTSYYSMERARAQLELVAHLRGGKISGTINGRPIFYVTKKLTDVSMIDAETGKPKKVKQWLIALEADVDMTRVFAAAEDRAVLAAGAEAVRALSGPDEIDPESDGDSSDEHENIKQARRVVFEDITVLNIDPMHYSAYASSKWGKAWSTDLESLQKAHSELQKAGDDQAVLEQIRNWKGGEQ